MKLRQLQYIATVVKSDFKISQAALKLHTTQPGVSTQIKLLEEELGSDIFVRHGKRITGLTPAGVEILKLAEQALLKIEAIKDISDDLKHEDRGTLSIATTHTQARYALPDAISAFVKEFPNVQLRIRQGNPTQISNMVLRGDADIAVATESISEFEELLVMPVYQWNRSVIVPPGHPLLQENPLTLEAIAAYPLVTYDFAFTGRSAMNNTFSDKGLTPNVALSAIDSDVIKHYVGLGLGVGILASMAFDKDKDTGLVAIDASHLFPESTTSIAVRKGRYLRHYMYRFMELFAPHLTRDEVEPKLMGVQTLNGS